MEWLKRELFGGWTKFEAFWLLLFLGIQIVMFAAKPDSLATNIAVITDILCVMFVGKGKINNYFFGLISVSLYAYISYTSKLYGEVMLNLFMYVPVQFIGFAIWRRHMTDQNTVNLGNAEEVKAKALTMWQWPWVVTLTVAGTLAYIEFLHYIGSALPTLDGVTVVISLVAQILMLLRYRKQWMLWILVNILTISLRTVMWLRQGETSLPPLLMYCIYLCNSTYGYINWTRLVRHHAGQAA